LEEEKIKQFGNSEKIIFGFFYIFTNILVLVSGVRLTKGASSFFIATEKGFCYQPAGISTGWILWEDIVDFSETTTLYRNPAINSPTLITVLGIKLTNPQKYNAAIYAPIFKNLATITQKLNNYQTEGLGDIILNSSDFGKDYKKVVALFKEQTKIK
jgi:hypothetical protein